MAQNSLDGYEIHQTKTVKTPKNRKKRAVNFPNKKAPKTRLCLCPAIYLGGYVFREKLVEKNLAQKIGKNKCLRPNYFPNIVLFSFSWD